MPQTTRDEPEMLGATGETGFEQLRADIEQLSIDLLRVLSARGEVAVKIGQVKDRLGLQYFDPIREREMLSRLLSANRGPFSDATVAHLFKEVFRASADLMGTSSRRSMRVHRREGEPTRTVDIADGISVGGGPVDVIAGPCAVESEESLDRVCRVLRELGVRLLRGGAFKPRTSPYSFQGLRREGLQILRRVATRYGMKTVSEVVDTRDVEYACEYVDVLQVGSRNMQNFELLRLVGQTNKPVLLKRGFMATLEELILAAEYVAMDGNDKLLICERGIRSFDRWTRNTLDIAAVPIIVRETGLPVVVDLSHSTGRKDLVTPLGLAAVAAGASALMVEVHDNPPLALSDSRQQLSPAEFERFWSTVLAASRSGNLQPTRTD